MKTKLITTFILVLCFLLSSVAFAGGPFAVDTVGDSGVAMRWQNDTLPWYLDPGPVSESVENSTGKTWVEEQLDKWEEIVIKNADGTNVSTVTFQSSYQGALPADVDASNYEDYVNYESGETTIIFDANGDITADLMGEANRENVVGLSAPLLSDSSGLYITKGFALFNGAILESGILAEDEATQNELFQATILHELGHLINLDHSQVNESVAVQCAAGGTTYQRNGSCENSQYIPTMYPELLTTMQGTLSRDDKVTLSWIYPSANFDANFCTITGEVFDENGDPLKGVNVIAKRAGESDSMAMLDSRSFVSGALQNGCSGNDSSYHLHGIVPGYQYEITYEPLNSDYSGASGFEPCDDPPSGFDAGTITTSGGSTTVSCSEAGQTVEMASQTVDVTGGGGGGGGDTPSTSSGGCSNIGRASGSNLRLIMAFFLLSLLAISAYRRRSRR